MPLWDDPAYSDDVNQAAETWYNSVREYTKSVGKDHPLNLGGVPDGFTPLRLSDKPKLISINPTYLPSQAFCSRSVRSQTIGGQIEV